MIFGIGLPKTGTTSLTKAMAMLGYKSKHYISNKDLKNIEKFDFISDLPIPTRFIELDKKYKNSKFIYTTRDIDTWLASCEAEWKRKSKPSVSRVLEMFSVPTFLDHQFKKVYYEHDRRVHEYFEDRSKDLLIFNIKEGWKPLCTFLNKDIPDKEFPHLNKRKPR